MEKGAFTLLITPFKEDFSVDEKALRKLLRRQMESDIHGIAPLGVTGETTLMNDEEIARVLKIVVDKAKGKKIIIPDTCTMSTWKTKERTKLYGDLGADYISVYSPFFVLPQPDAIRKFFEEVADTSPIPLVLHNSKGRTGVEITPDITAYLAKHPNIVGIKDGNKDMGHLAKVLYLTKDEDFHVYTGKDTTAFPLLAMGGSGTFTVSGNIVPDVMGKIINYSVKGEADKAMQLHLDYFELFEACRFETNPMGAKKALELMGVINGAIRPPLTKLGEEKTIKLKRILSERSLI